MSISRDRLTYLFRNYYAGVATTAETNELMTWVRKGEHDPQLGSLIKEEWYEIQNDSYVFSPETSKRILSSILPDLEAELRGRDLEDALSTGRNSHFWRRWSIAAAIVLFCITGTFWIRSERSHKDKDHILVDANDILPGTNKAILTLGDGSVIDLDGTEEGLLTRQGAVEITKTNDGQLIYEKSIGQEDNPQINIVATPKGGQFQIKLPDNSLVWLNASSSIRFPSSFPIHERRVEVTGEVYFEVSYDNNRPFRVIFSKHEIEVLGTSFNISNYDDENGSQATLVEGAVLLKSAGKTTKLLPGQGAFIENDGTTEISAVDVEEITAWKNGLFYFQDESIDLVMRQVSRWYNIEIEFEGDLPSKRVTGKVRRDVNFEEFMHMLSYLGINYKVNGRKVIVYDTSSV